MQFHSKRQYINFRLNLEIDTMIIHENYNPTEQTHDIALLKVSSQIWIFNFYFAEQLKEKVDLNIYTPACLSDAGKDWAGVILILMMILMILIKTLINMIIILVNMLILILVLLMTVIMIMILMNIHDH